MLTLGVDFRCSNRAGEPLPICFGVGTANHRLFQQLQQLINRFSIRSNEDPTPVAKLRPDGFLGPATVAALQQAAGNAFAFGGGDTTFHAFMDHAVPKELIAAHAPELVAAFRAAVPVAAARGVQLVSPSRSTVTGQSPRRTPIESGLSVAGVLALVGLGIIAYRSWKDR